VVVERLGDEPFIFRMVVQNAELGEAIANRRKMVEALSSFGLGV
jgi:hypothetical protein